MAAEVHLPEAVLRVHVALCEEEVVVGLGDELRDAGIVAVHGDRGGEPGNLDATAGRRERALHRPPSDAGPDDADHEYRDEQADQEAEAPVAAGSRSSVPTSLLREAHGEGRRIGGPSTQL